MSPRSAPRPARRCANCGGEIRDSWGRTYCSRYECAAAAKKSVEARSVGSTWRRTARYLESRGLPVPWHAERPCGACGRPYEGAAMRLYCGRPECRRARNREKARKKREKMAADPELRERTYGELRRRRRERYAGDPEFAARVRRANRLSYARRVGREPSAADLEGT